MKRAKIDFELLAGRAMLNPAVSHMGPVIRKELLHYDILFCLERNGLLKNLVFRGGTSLRLCYGSQRYSEDLDFVGGRDFSSSSLNDIKAVLEEYLGTRYGLEMQVKDPCVKKEAPENSMLRVDKWQVMVLTEPERLDRPRQRIKIEVANIPAYTLETHQVRQNYPFLPDGHNNILVGVESPEEIMADKLLSLTHPEYIRYRDIWDLFWLQGQGIRVRPDLVEAKTNDYGITNFPQRMDNLVERSSDIVSSDDFKSQLHRILPEDIFNNSVRGERPREAMYRTITGLYRELKNLI